MLFPLLKLSRRFGVSWWCRENLHGLLLDILALTLPITQRPLSDASSDMNNTFCLPSTSLCTHSSYTRLYPVSLTSADYNLQTLRSDSDWFLVLWLQRSSGSIPTEYPWRRGRLYCSTRKSHLIGRWNMLTRLGHYL